MCVCFNKIASFEPHAHKLLMLPMHPAVRYRVTSHKNTGKCDWANKNGPSGHIKFLHIFQICCIITNDLLKPLK